MNTDPQEASTQEPAPAPERVAHHIEPTIELNAIEARVLGCLIEKSYLTPDVYPMTTNSLVTACNQKTSRDPVVSYSATEVDAVLLELRQRKLIRRVHTQGARSTKHRHAIDEVVPLTEQQIVLLSVLLLRGDQTVNELRTRTERHGVFDDAAAVHSCLETLESRGVPFVGELPRQSGQKDTRWRHLLSDGTEVVETSVPEPAESTAPAIAEAAAASAPATGSSGLAGRVETLEAQVASLQAQLQNLAASLGEELT